MASKDKTRDLQNKQGSTLQRDSMPPLEEKNSVVSVLNRRGWKGFIAPRGAEIPGPWTVVTGCEGNDTLNSKMHSVNFNSIF